MTPIQQTQEQARAFQKMQLLNKASKDTVLDFQDAVIIKTWNAALDEAIGALPESMIANGMHDWGEVNGYNGAIQESRTALEALKIPV